MHTKINRSTVFAIVLFACTWGCTTSEQADIAIENRPSSLETQIADDIKTPSSLDPTVLVAAVDPTEQDDGDLDLTIVKIESEQAQKLIGSPTIKVRSPKTQFQPTGRVPIPILETVDDELCKEHLLYVTQEIAGQKTEADQIEDVGGIFVARGDDASTWISRASGVYKFTKTRDSMAIPTKFEDFKQAVQTALDYVGKKQLVTLAEGEEMDILFVSAVKNAMSTMEEISLENNPEEWKERMGSIDPDSPLLDDIEPDQMTFNKVSLKEAFISDYYVGFGRRFRGIPVIGSQLVIRLDGNGETAMVLKQWRELTDQIGRVVPLNDKSLAELIVAHPEFYKRYSQNEVSPDEITIVSKTCGYMSGPANYRQTELRVGCEIRFTFLESKDEAFPVIIVPLDDGEHGTLWGTK